MTTTNTTSKAVTTSFLTNNGHIEGLRLDFAGGDSITITEHQLSQDIANRGLWHGISAKLVDATAISRNPDTGRSASVADKYNAALGVYERLIAGQWNKTREAGTVSGGLLLRALCQLYPTKTVEQVREYLAGKTPEERTALRRLGRVATIIETLRDAGADSDGVDTAAMLDELNN